MRLYITLFFTFLCTISNVNGQSEHAIKQDLIINKGRHYYLGNEVYSYRELIKLYPDDLELAKDIRRSANLGTVGTVLGISSLVMIGGAVMTGSTCEDLGCLAPYAFLAYATGFGIVGTLFKAKSNVRKKKSIHSLNNRIRKESQIDHSQIQIRPAKSGLGIAIVF